MFRKLFPCTLAVAVVFLSLTRAEPQVTKPPPQPTKPQPSTGGGKVVPKLEPIAETKLLMEGLAHANFRGLDRILAKKPEEAQAWTFGRGQAFYPWASRAHPTP